MERTNEKMMFQAEELEQRLEMARLSWFARTNPEDPRIEAGGRLEFDFF